MTKHIFIVFTNALDGHEDEFNSWYDDVHIDQVLDVPGIASARRFRLSHTQRADPPYPHEYMTLYEVDTDDIAGLLDRFAERSGTERMLRTETIAPDNVSYFYAPVGKSIAAPVDKG